MNAHICSLQEQVSTLFSNLNALHSSQDYILPSIDSSLYPRHESRSQSVSQPSFHDPKSPSRTRGKQPRFQGPTSSAFNFDVAKSSLQTMGITRPEDSVDEGVVAQNATPPPPAPAVVHPSKDPLWVLGKDEAIRLCRVYEEEMGITYPILDIDKMVRQALLLFTFMESATRTGLAQRGLPGTDSLDDDETKLLKMVLATALIVEGSGQSELGQRLFESVRQTAESSLWGPVNIDELKLLVVVTSKAQYHFQMDEEAQAYRVIGLAARLCLELGLHRREILIKTFSNEEECSWAIKLFWSVYVLDRRWSFGTGMPFALQDSDLDPLLPEPDGSTPYLTAMIAYSRIGSKVWRSVAGFDGTGSDVRKDEIGYLDYQVLQWHKAIPDSLAFFNSDTGQEAESNSRAMRRLRILIYLRANQMRILIYRSVLHSATSIMENRGYAQTVVDVAKDTIRVLTHLNQTSDIYRTQQVCFNYFLVSALAVLFLAVSHAPADFNRQVRDEFYMALDLVKGFSTKSYISKRLWNTIRGLKEVGPKLGLFLRPSNLDSNDAHSTAAVAMAGLAGHTVDELAIFPTAQGVSPLGTSPKNGLQMSYELTTLFEAAGGYGNDMSANSATENVNGFGGSHGEMPASAEGLPGIIGNEQEFSRIMRDLF
ncbi:MAG: hypothetical protein M1830_009433 [Pleopsidium flavum]|nr:MAG: hypothetical protein M1830_009433 [Pleopsidium flavum]